MQQFPFWVREALATIDFENVNAIIQTLINLDLVITEKKRIMNHKQNFQQTNKFNEDLKVRNMNVNKRKF